MTNDTIKNIRSINLHVGRLTAIKWVRKTFNLSFSVARLAVDDIITNKPWTNPAIKADLNKWDLDGVRPV
jgi:hypothetical protein